MRKYEKTPIEKRISKQKAFDYCIYMMLTGFFRKTVCINPVMEKNLFLYYKDLNDNTAVSMEKEALRILEKEIMPNFSEDLSEEDAKIYILPFHNIYMCHGIQVRTRELSVTMYVQKDGRNKNVSYEILNMDKPTEKIIKKFEKAA